MKLGAYTLHTNTITPRKGKKNLLPKVMHVDHELKQNCIFKVC